MDLATNRANSIACVVVLVQLIMIHLVDSIWGVLLPPLIASGPIATLIMRSPQTVGTMAPSLRRSFLVVVILGCPVAASFAFFHGQLSFDFQFTRAIFLDIAMLWLASIVGVRIFLRTRS